MKFGMNLLLWSGDLTDELLPVLEKLKAMGYDGVELPIFDPDVEKFARWGKRLDELGLERTAVTIRTAADNPISPDAKIRAAGVAATKQTLDCCQAVGAPDALRAVSLGHRRVHRARADGRRMEVGRRQHAANRRARQASGVMLGVEYLNRFECYFLNTAADTVRFVKEVNHPSCRMMYDTFHANIEEKSSAEAIRIARALHGPCAHFRKRPQHAGAGQRRLGRNFTRTRKRPATTAGWSIEAFGLALPEMAAATKIWRRMYDSEEQLARDGLAFMKKHAGG